MKNKIIYAITGVILLLANFSMRVTSIDDTTLSLIEEVEAFDTTSLWEGFDTATYTKDIWYNFNKEYRYEAGTITEQEPDQPVVSIEALKLAGDPLIKAIPYNKFRSIYESQSAGSTEYMRAYYKSFFIHESFHCYQMEHGLSLVYDISEKNEAAGDRPNEVLHAIELLDDDKEYQKLWEDEYMALITLYNTAKADSYKKAQAKRLEYIKAKFPDLYDDIYSYNSYKEFIEGTAELVQEKYLAEVTGADDKIQYEDRVFYTTDRTYYTEGALKARILDKYNSSWRENLSFGEENNLDILLERGNIL